MSGGWKLGEFNLTFSLTKCLNIQQSTTPGFCLTLYLRQCGRHLAWLHVCLTRLWPVKT